ncbi:MAG: magnesium transporter [Planctomycetes bacterium RBG_13_63_9]|nr:MAG: magnesium transporter [Planctomycetes bacterium RBG_13_63_9]
MTNTLYLPELREMLAENDAASLTEFCTALHPARTAEFMEGLTAKEAWGVLQHADVPLQVEVFGYFDEVKQIELIETLDRAEIAKFIGHLPPDDRVDLLAEVRPWIVEELMPLISSDERRDIQRLSAYPEGTAGAVMTTQFARLSEDLKVGQALREIGQQAEELETIYYIYVVDEEDHLRGLVSARQLVSAMGKPDVLIGDLMERDLVTVHVAEDQEEVADKVAHYDLLAIPVVDDEHHMLGIITHDDVIDVVREEATEDAHRIAAVEPLSEGYLQTHLFTLTWKRGLWLTILFFGAMLTALALREYQSELTDHIWLALFIPMVISTGGNTGNQSATLIITALSTGDVKLADWWRVVRRELMMGLLLGSFLAVIGYCCALAISYFCRLLPDPSRIFVNASVVPITLVLVILCSTMLGSVLPLLFRRLGLDPAMMSNPFVAGLIDVLGIVIYMQVALAVL